MDPLRPVLERRSRPTSDRRKEPRFICRERLLVQALLCPEQPQLVGRTEAGRVMDISASGIHFYCTAALPVDSLVDLWVDISSRPGKFFLSGMVRWSQGSAAASHGIGVELDEGPATDISAWRARLR